MKAVGGKVSPRPKAGKGKTALVCALLAVATLMTYWPVAYNAFTNYDDGYYVTENPLVQRGLSWEGLAWAFGSLHGEHTYWHPLTWISHMVDCEVFGLKAWGHHLVNLLFHTFNTVLVFLVFLRMTGAFWRCAILAALFALHPLQVDTVAWVAERKNLLSALFWMLTMWAYARYVEKAEGRGQKTEGAGQRAEDRGQGSGVRGLRPLLHPPASFFYAFSLLLFALGLMCKPVLVTLPFVLLLLDYWPLKRLELNGQHSRLKTLLPLVREKLPFFGLAAVSCLVTIMAHRGLGMLDVAFRPPLDLRIENALVSYIHYLGSAFYPAKLAVFYPYPGVVPMGAALLSVLLLLGLSALAIGSARNRPYLLVGWFWFLGVLVPFIGLVQAGSQAMADRFAYVPLIGLFLAVVWSAEAMANRWRHGLVIVSAVAVAALVACAGGTRRQISYWKDDESLFGHALAVTENNALSQLNLGAALNAKGRFGEAIGHLQEAVRLSPGTAKAHINLAYALAQKDRLAEAVKQYEAALELDPADAGVHNDLGLTLARQGRVKDAIRHYHEALRSRPGFAEAHYNLGLSLASVGDYRGAAVQFRQVVRQDPANASARQKLDRALAAQEQVEHATEPYQAMVKANPGDARAHRELGRVLLQAGQVGEAIGQYSEAVRLEPKSAEAHYQLGAALARDGEREKAAIQFQAALESDSQLAVAHYALGIVRQQQQQIPEALRHWREAVRLAPEWPEPLNNLAWALATDPAAGVRNGLEAVKLAERAVELSGTNNIGMLDTLAAAYAEAGRFAEAGATARQAQDMAVAQGQRALAVEIGQRVALYDARQPYRRPPDLKQSASSVP